MIEIKNIISEKPAHILNPSTTEAYSTSEPVENKPWILSTHVFKNRKIPRVSTDWTMRDYVNAFRCRASQFRNNYTVSPGLYAAGSPDAESPVIVTANYKYTFDIVRKELKDRNIWILILDTAGINVWCAAGKGTFGTKELIHRIKKTSLTDIINHKKIIVPQLGAPGISAHDVQRATCCRVLYGPVYAKDMPMYLDENFKASPKMRIIRFTLYDRFVLTPMEMNPAVKKIILPALGVLAFCGLTTQGIIFDLSLRYGLPLAAAICAGLFTGAFVTPLLLPFLPFRSFAAKGMTAGITAAGLLYLTTDLYINYPILLTASAAVMLTGISSYLALQFTGTSTFTNMSGVEKELRIFLPVYGFMLIAAVVLLMIEKFYFQGMI